MKHVYLFRYRPCGMPDGEFEVFFSSFRAAKAFMLNAHPELTTDPTVDLTLENDNRTRLYLSLGLEEWDIFRIDVRQTAKPLPQDYIHTTRNMRN